MEDKRYKVETLDDIISFIDENNIDNFAEDFKQWLGMIVTLKMTAKAAGLSTESLLKKGSNFIWIDDGKHEGSVKITAREDEKISLTLKTK